MLRLYAVLISLSVLALFADAASVHVQVYVGNANAEAGTALPPAFCLPTAKTISAIDIACVSGCLFNLASKEKCTINELKRSVLER